MNSRLHESFRRDFARLPAEIQRRARLAYQRFKVNPSLPGLQFKPLPGKEPLWSVRVTDDYRAVGARADDGSIVWFFIGTHAQYDQFLSRY